MTRVVIFGDLHANWEALLALQQAERRPDVVLFLGDAVGDGPDPKRCLDSVRATSHYSIGGFHDFAVGNGHQPNGPDLLTGSWAHTRRVLAGDDRAYLAALPADLAVEIGGTRFYLTRLQPDDPESETRMLITMPQAQLKERFGKIEADIILLGGPHIPAMRQVGSQLIVCPGSLGQPRYGVSDPTFAAWHDGRVQIHHLHYHPQTTVQKLSLLPLDPEHVLHLQAILQTGGVD